MSKLEYSFSPYTPQGKLLSHTDSFNATTHYSTDKAGNNAHRQSTYDTRMNQLLEDAQYRYTYDGNGNLNRKIDKQTNHMHFYRYNDFNQLIEHYRADETDHYVYRLLYTYDGFNRRITKTYSDSKDKTKSYAHHYLYDDQNIIAILDANNNKQLLATIVHHPSQVDTPLSITNHETNRTYYYHRDHQGSIVALTNQEGNIVENIEYDGHYGTILNHTKQETTLNPYGYTGRETDLKDLYYYRARYYDPTTQRFLSRDPIEFEAGDFNFYRYVSNDPVNFVDPSGLDVKLCKRPAEAAFGIVDHHWIVTDTKSGGMWNAPGTKYPDKPFLADVAVKEHSKETKELLDAGGSCEIIKNVDENKVNAQLEEGRKLGIWKPWNQCQTFAQDVIDNARPNGYFDYIFGQDNHTTQPIKGLYSK